MAEKEIKFDIVQSIGAFNPNGPGGWTRELNFVSWNEREPKLDIRDWSPDHSRMGKGVTLTRDEATRLVDMMSSWLKR